MSFIIAQIIGAIAIVLLIYSSAKKVGRKPLLIFNILINLLWAIHYIMLDARSGCACSVIAAIMVFASYFKGNNKFMSSPAVPVFFSIVFIVFGLITYQNPISIIPIVGNILVTVAFWNDKEYTIKSIFVVVAFMWVVYGGLIGSVISVIGQSMSFFTNLSYVIRHRKRRGE